MNRVTTKSYSDIFYCSLLVLCLFSTTAVKALQKSGADNSTDNHVGSHSSHIETSSSDLSSGILSTDLPSITPSPSFTVTATDSDSISDFTSPVPMESVTGTPLPDNLLPCTSSTIVNQLPDHFLNNFAKQHSIPLSSFKCLVIEAGNTDISEELSQIEPDTLVLLKQDNPGQPMLVSRAQVLPKNAWIIGVNLHDPVGEVRIDAVDGFKGKHWLEISDSDTVAVSIGNAGISHLDFRAPVDFTDNSIDSIVYSRCFTGTLSLLSSSFYLDRRASVYYQCFGSSDGDQSSLVFRNNRVYGYNLNRVSKGLDDDSRKSLEGIFVEIPNTSNNPQAVIITDSQFFGNMETGIEVTVGEKSTAEVSRVEINKNNSGSVDHGLQLNPRANDEDGNNFYKIESGYFNARTSVELFGTMRAQFTSNTLAGDIAMRQHRQDIGYTGFQEWDYGMLTFTPGSTGNQWSGLGCPYQFLQPYTGSLEFTETSSLSPSSTPTPSTQSSSSDATVVDSTTTALMLLVAALGLLF